MIDNQYIAWQLYIEIQLYTLLLLPISSVLGDEIASGALKWIHLIQHVQVEFQLDMIDMIYDL